MRASANRPAHRDQPGLQSPSTSMARPRSPFVIWAMSHPRSKRNSALDSTTNPAKSDAVGMQIPSLRARCRSHTARLENICITAAVQVMSVLCMEGDDAIAGHSKTSCFESSAVNAVSLSGCD
ncbi:hypothetical protein F4824DRAFT_497920 [Ustulina deusta]|nr:hypothetical protein F4824DRAFT_497920 [Ustulina deusta]